MKKFVFKNKIYPLNCIFIVSLDIKDMEVFTTEDGRKIVKISLYELVFYLKFILWNEKNNKDNNKTITRSKDNNDFKKYERFKKFFKIKKKRSKK